MAHPPNERFLPHTKNYSSNSIVGQAFFARYESTEPLGLRRIGLSYYRCVSATGRLAGLGRLGNSEEFFNPKVERVHSGLN